MKLQLAIDLFTSAEARALLDEIIDLVGIVEIGTPLIIREGVNAVSVIKKAYPNTRLLADLKIVDAGAHEAQLGFDAGADIVTVLGVAHEATIEAAINQARQYKGQVMIDMIAIDDIQHRAKQLDALGCDYICVHTGSDAQAKGENPLVSLSVVNTTLSQTKVAVAGGISPETLPQIAAYKPDIVIVGSYITSHPNKRQAVLNIRKHLE